MASASRQGFRYNPPSSRGLCASVDRDATNPRRGTAANGFFPLVAFALILVSILRFLFFRDRRQVGHRAYRKHETLLPPEHQALYRALKQAVGDEFALFAKVPVYELISPVEGALDRSARVAWDALSHQCFAFVLCRHETLEAVAAIAATVPQGRGGRRFSGGGEFMADLCDAAGLPLIDIEMAPLYHVPALREAVHKALNPTPLSQGLTDGRQEPHISSLDQLDLN